jgi:hypothetical protein
VKHPTKQRKLREMKTKNPVAKFNNEFNKPRTFRDRKSHAKQSGDYGDKPKHQPYKREKPVLEDGEFEDNNG